MIATKGRRKLIHDGRRFIWYVKEDDDSCDMILHVISDDKLFNIQYVLGQDEESCHVVVIGREFAGGETGGCWKRFLAPRFDPHGVATPRSIARLIEWSLSAEPRKAVPGSMGGYGSAPDVEGYLIAKAELENDQGEGVAPKSATRSESDSGGDDIPQPESKSRPR